MTLERAPGARGGAARRPGFRPGDGRLGYRSAGRRRRAPPSRPPPGP